MPALHCVAQRPLSGAGSWPLARGPAKRAHGRPEALPLACAVTFHLDVGGQPCAITYTAVLWKQQAQPPCAFLTCKHPLISPSTLCQPLHARDTCTYARLHCDAQAEPCHCPPPPGTWAGPHTRATAACFSPCLSASTRPLAPSSASHGSQQASRGMAVRSCSARSPLLLHVIAALPRRPNRASADSGLLVPLLTCARLHA